jgi:hypothetical protein
MAAQRRVGHPENEARDKLVNAIILRSYRDLTKASLTAIAVGLAIVAARGMAR